MTLSEAVNSAPVRCAHDHIVVGVLAHLPSSDNLKMLDRAGATISLLFRQPTGHTSETEIRAPALTRLGFHRIGSLFLVQLGVSKPALNWHVREMKGSFGIPSNTATVQCAVFEKVCAS